LLVQQYRQSPLQAKGDFASLSADIAGNTMRAEIVAGAGAERLIAARGYGTYFAADARAANVRLLPSEAMALAARPLYSRAPDAKPMAL
jgi:hypothetical protein